MELTKTYWLVLTINIFLLTAYYIIESPTQDIGFQSFNLIKRYQKYIRKNIDVELSQEKTDQQKKGIEERTQQYKEAVRGRTKTKNLDNKNHHNTDDTFGGNYNDQYTNSLITGIDIFQKIKFFENWPTNRYEQTVLSLKKDKFTCLFNNIHLLIDHSIIEKQRNILTDYSDDSLFRKNLKEFGKDILNLSLPFGIEDTSKDVQYLTQSKKYFPIHYNTTIFFTKNEDFIDHFSIGKDALCVFQISNHIKGREQLIRRDQLASNIMQIVVFIQQFARKVEKYILLEDNYDTINIYFERFQKFFIQDEKSCKMFFLYLDGHEYLRDRNENNIKYIVRNSVKGPIELDAFQEMRLRRKYENGLLCGQIVDDFLVQKRIVDLLTLEEHQFSIFAYMLVASTDPLIVYFKDGQIEMKGQIKSTYVSYETFQQSAKKPFDLIQEVKNQLAQLMISLEDKFHKDSRLFELFRVEFLVDQDYSLYLTSITSNIQKDDQEKQIYITLYKETLILQHNIQRQKFNKLRPLIYKSLLKNDDLIDLTLENKNELIKSSYYEVLVDFSKETRPSLQEFCKQS